MTDAAVETPALDTAMPVETAEVAPAPEQSEDEILSAAFDAAQSDEQENHAPASEPTDEAPEPEQVVDVPSDVPGPLKDVWATLPAPARESLLTSHRDMAGKVSDAARQSKGLQPIMDAVKQAAAEIPEFAKQTPAEVSASVLELARIGESFRQDPAGTIKYLAQHNGVDLRELVGGQPQGQQGQADARTISGLRQELAQVKQHLGQLTPDAIMQQVDQRTTHRTMEQEVSKFSQSDGVKDHWAAVEDKVLLTLPVAMQALGQGAAPQAVLQSAYDMAIQQFLPSAKAQAPAGDEPAVTPDPARTEAVLRAKSVKVVGKPGGQSRAKSSDEAMAEIWDRNHA